MIPHAQTQRGFIGFWRSNRLVSPIQNPCPSVFIRGRVVLPSLTPPIRGGNFFA
jgi:hypothetical protein